MFLKSWLINRYDILVSIILDIIIFSYLKQIENNNISIFENILFLVIWIILSYNFERYGRRRRISLIRLILKNLYSSLFVFLLISTIFIFLFEFDFYSFNYLFLGFLGTSLLIQTIWMYSYFHLKVKMYINLVGSEGYKKYLKKYIAYFNFADFLFIDDQLKNNQLKNNQHNIILSEENKENTKKWCEETLHLIPSKLVNNQIIKELNDGKSKTFYFLIKRIADIFISLILLFLSLPLLILFSLLIFIEDQGPIFYTQIRVGFKGKNFKIFKLRTMKMNSENGKALWSSEKDPRITKIGKILRITRIDEIPQIWNVLRNDMSLIGPRPERPELANSLSKDLPLFRLRSNILPGLSGWAQVNYPYASSLSETEMKLSFDFFYMKNASLLLDIIIFFKTIKLVFNGRGAIPKKSID